MITLAEKHTEFGKITILQSRVKGSHIYCQEDWLQSEADRNGVSLAAYVHAIFGLLMQLRSLGRSRNSMTKSQSAAPEFQAR